MSRICPGVECPGSRLFLRKSGPVHKQLIPGDRELFVAEWFHPVQIVIGVIIPTGELQADCDRLFRFQVNESLGRLGSCIEDRAIVDPDLQVLVGETDQLMFPGVSRKQKARVARDRIFG